MAGAEAGVNIGAIGAVIVAAVAAAEVIDGLAGEALGGKSSAGDDDLAVFIAVSGVGGLVTRHLLEAILRL
jgi:hypothetical protein